MIRFGGVWRGMILFVDIVAGTETTSWIAAAYTTTGDHWHAGPTELPHEPTYHERLAARRSD